MSEQQFIYIITLLIPLLFAITIHEYAHGFVADKLGDKTARMLGRLSLNPLNHIDFIGTLDWQWPHLALFSLDMLNPCPSLLITSKMLDKALSTPL
jgi:Zn-dependent protease